jgi:hypothetical protein
MTEQPAWLPGHSQQLLLDACLLDDVRARNAFTQWRSFVDVDRLDAGSYRLLPLLWKRMCALGIEDRSREMFKGIYRKTWYFNQLAIAGAARILRTLSSARVPAMALKGIALTLESYRDAGLRSMGDVDIAVPRRFAREAVEALVEDDWKAEVTPLTGARIAGSAGVARWTVGPRPARDFDDDYFDARHAHGFGKAGSVEVDLHWFLLQGNCEPCIDDSMWAHARPLTVAGITALSPSPADHLLLLLAHGARWNPIPPVRWVADAVTLIRTGPELAWEKVVESARRRDLVLVARNLLGYLEKRFAVGVPAIITRELNDLAVTKGQQRSYEVRVSPPGIAAGIEEIRFLRTRYLTSRRTSNNTNARRSFPAYVRHVLGAASLPHVGGYAVSEILRRI